MKINTDISGIKDNTMKRNILPLISVFFICLLTSQFSIAQNRVDATFPKENLFSLGSYYYPEQWDESQWDRDLGNMAAMGIKFTHFA